jgi:hypothetical protein
VSRDFAPPFSFRVAIIRNKVFTEKPEDLDLLETVIEVEFQMVDENKNE